MQVWKAPIPSVLGAGEGRVGPTDSDSFQSKLSGVPAGLRPVTESIDSMNKPVRLHAAISSDCRPKHISSGVRP